MDIEYTGAGDGTETFKINPSMSADEKQQTAGVLRLYTPGRQRGRMSGVSGIASCFYYVSSDTLIGDVVEELNTRETLLAIGMVNGEGEATGVITRRELFNLLGRSFGEEAARDMPVSRVARETRIYREDASIVTVSEQIAEEMKMPTLRFFLIADSVGKFAGIFSTRDIMTFLSSVMRKDLDMAGQIQSRIVPEETAMKHGTVEVVASTQMAMGVGGDFYAIRRFSGERWFLMTADVSGKGMGASLLTSIAGGFIHMYDFSSGVKRFIKELNGYIYNTFNAERFITSVFMTLDGASGMLSIYDMGHSMVYLLRKNRFHNLKARENFPLGITDNIEPSSASLRLEPGDILLVVTDGVIEQCNVEKEEYGIERCAEIISGNRCAPLSSIVNMLKKDINGFIDDGQQYDDITFMLVRYG